MNKRKLGKTGILLSELGYGCTAQFGKDFLGKPGINEEQAFSLVSTALDSGVTFLDTGFNYGYAEERLGRCLSSIFREGIWKREDIIIQTKCCETLNKDGTYGKQNYSTDWIKKSVEISLKRLQTEYIDLLALHGAKISNISDELLYLFDDLKRQKIIRAYGVAGITDDFGNWICEHQCFDYVMLTYNFTEARRNNLIDKLGKKEIGILSGGSLNQSLNTIKLIPHNRNELWYTIRAIVRFRNKIKRTRSFEFTKYINGMTPQQASLVYILENKNITSAVFNTINIRHLKENIDASKMILPTEVKEKIESIK